MSAQAFAVFNVFVPVGSGITADDLVSGNELTSTAEYPTGTVILRVFEYLDIHKVKRTCVKGNHFIITTGDVFCCGHRYTNVDEYKKMVNSVFPSSKYRVIDINKIHSGKTTQEVGNNAVITWTSSVYCLDGHIMWWLGWATTNTVPQLYVASDVAVEKQMIMIKVHPSVNHPSAEVVTGESVDNPVVVPDATTASVDNPVVVPDAPAIAPAVVSDTPATNLTTTPPDNSDTSSALRVAVCPDLTIPAWCGRCQRWH